MPPSGVSMSTFFSSPCAFFFTFTLHAGKSMADSTTAASRALAARNCRFMLRPSMGELRPALDSGAALRDVGNAHRQVAVNCNLAEQCFHGADLRNRGI